MDYPLTHLTCQYQNRKHIQNMFHHPIPIWGQIFAPEKKILCLGACCYRQKVHPHITSDNVMAITIRIKTNQNLHDTEYSSSTKFFLLPWKICSKNP